MPKGEFTRQKILDYAIGAVAEVGYTNTTTQVVLDRSGVSRGSLLHQFLSRTDLMVGVAEAAMNRMLTSIGDRMTQGGDGIEGLFRYPDIFWETLIQPPALAFYEIQMASRWDHELRARLKDQFERVERHINEGVGTIAQAARMKDIDGFLVHLGIITDALPGMAARRVLTNDPARIDAERAALTAWYVSALTARLPKRLRIPRHP